MSTDLYPHFNRSWTYRHGPDRLMSDPVLYECQTCGAAVSDYVRHAEWHNATTQQEAT